MGTEGDVSLETDGLENVIESTVPPQSVVVVQYKNRGVPPWLVVPLVFVVPVCAIMAYHRWVVEPERLRQGKEASQILNDWIASNKVAQQPADKGQQPGGAGGRRHRRRRPP